MRTSYEAAVTFHNTDGTHSARRTGYGITAEDARRAAGYGLWPEVRGVIGREVLVIEMDAVTGGAVRYEVIEARCDFIWGLI